MTFQCAWCHPPGSPSHDDTASHGMCPKCAKEHLLVLPLLAALATLRGPSFMGDDAKAKCAQLIDTVVSRLNRDDLIHLFAESPQSPAPSPVAMPVAANTSEAAEGDTSERTR